jgi:hypothetical protein
MQRLGGQMRNLIERRVHCFILCVVYFMEGSEKGVIVL